MVRTIEPPPLMWDVVSPVASFRFSGVFSDVAAKALVGDASIVATAIREGLLSFIEGDPEGGVAHHIGAFRRAL
jgi:hypothetical protein